jgi:hypothetical protein
MFKENLDRVCAFCIAEFEPKVSHLGRRNAALEAAQRHFQATNWQGRGGSLILQNPDAKAIFQLDVRLALFQTLGLDSWDKDGLVSALTDALRELGVDEIKKAIFTTRVFFSTGMSHAEMVGLLPGTFLAPTGNLTGILGHLEDAFVQVYGTHEGCKVGLTVAPMNAQDTEASVMSTNNLGLFLKNALLDRRVKEFRDKMGTDATLLVQVEFSREAVGMGELGGFVSQCVQGAETVSDNAVRHLKSLRPKR